MDKKQKNILIGIAVAVLIVVAAIGVAVWVISSNNEVKGSDRPYTNSTPTGGVEQQVGSVGITPTQVTLSAGPDGRLIGTTIVAALFRDFTVTDAKFEGDMRLTYQSDCLKKGAVIKAGQQCQVTIGMDSTKKDANALATPSFYVLGNSTTPGGDPLVVEARANVAGTVPGTDTAEGTPIPGAAGVAGAPNAAGTPLAAGGAPSTIDPYGPVAPQQQSQNNGPPVDNNQQQMQRTLTPREQFMIARRQAVLGNVVMRNAQGAQVAQSTGDWDEIKVPKVVSSAPQDMSRVVTMDRIITAVLVRPFDSRQAQQVIAQVDRNVYGGMGRNILIPRGSTIIGNMGGGADRAVVVWSQIIRPDGARFVFSGTGGDAMGQAGVPGRVNNRWLQRISGAFLGTVLKIGTALAVDPQEQAGGNNVSIGGQGGSSGVARNKGAIILDITSQGINETLGPIIEQQKTVKPIITVPAGTRLTIVPTQDLVMRPIERETIVRQQYPRQMNGGAQITPPPSFEEDGQQSQGNRGQRQLSGYDAQQQQTANQQSVGRSLQTSPVAPSSTPPWGSN
jgi:type IV secretory pathway VirB10-like protein